MITDLFLTFAIKLMKTITFIKTKQLKTYTENRVALVTLAAYWLAGSWFPSVLILEPDSQTWLFSSSTTLVGDDILSNPILSTQLFLTALP